jgi:hypothetical protein
VSRPSEWHEVGADTYLDHRHRNWVLAEELGDVVFVAARGIVLVHRERAEHIARALGGRGEVMPLQLVATLPLAAPLRLPATPAPAPTPGLQELAAGTGGRRRDVLGWLGIMAGAAVFIAALAVPLDDAALVLALMLKLRAARLIVA